LSKVINMDLATFNYKCFYIIKWRNNRRSFV
jgi:hypothetical protein